MRGRTESVAAVALFALLVGASSALAQQNIVNIDFDETFAAYTYGYDYSGGGDQGGPNIDHSALSTNATSTMANGRGGGNAFTVSGDFSQVPVNTSYNYYGIGGGLGSFRYDFPTNTTLGVPSGNLADYTFTFDLGGAGFTQAAEAVVEVQFQVPDDRITPDANTDFDPFASVRFTIPGVGVNYETFTFKLDQGTLIFNEARVPAADRDFALHAPDIGLLNSQFQIQSNFGPDNDNQMFVDNVRLTVVPEPASGVLLVGGLALGMARRPRRARRA